MKSTPRPSLKFAVLALAASALAACSGERAPGQSQPVGDTAPATATAAPPAGQEVERTRIAQAIADASGIVVRPVGPGRISTELQVQGLLTPIDGSVAQATARFPGQVRALRVNVGDRVAAGQTVALVESNLSLTTYAVTAPIAGRVMNRQAQLGGGVAEGQLLFEIADLSKVWVDLHAFGADLRHLRPGARVKVSRLYDGASAEVTLERILPGTVTASQSAVARATLVNDDGLWRPGTAVSARIAIEDRQVAMSVPLTALQSMDGRDVVFVRAGEVYQARPVQLGERDSGQVEVIDGLQAGQQVVVEQSYLVKADIEKAGASHAH